MAYVPMNRTRALIICTHPQDYLPARLREAARYLLDRRDATEEERRLAGEAIDLLRSKRGEPSPDDDAKPQDEPHPRRKGRGRSSHYLRRLRLLLASRSTQVAIELIECSLRAGDSRLTSRDPLRCIRA